MNCTIQTYSMWTAHPNARQWYQPLFSALKAVALGFLVPVAVACTRCCGLSRCIVMYMPSIVSISVWLGHSFMRIPVVKNSTRAIYKYECPDSNDKPSTNPALTDCAVYTTTTHTHHIKTHLTIVVRYFVGRDSLHWDRRCRRVALTPASPRSFARW